MVERAVRKELVALVEGIGDEGEEGREVSQRQSSWTSMSTL